MSAKAVEREPKFRRRAEARPEEVLDAALDLFIERGFASTRVEDIAARAGLSKGAVYLYFPSKEAVLEGIVRRAIVPIASSAVEMAQNYAGDPRTIITLVMKNVAARMTEPRTIAIPKLMMREMINFPDFAQMYRREVLDKVIPMITGLLRTGIAEGYLRPVDPELTIRSLVGPIMLHVLLDEVFGIRAGEELGMDRLVDNHLTILFDGLSAPASNKRFMAT
ncbi:MAG: TetR/AcrR family transcriptional regulator [Devosia sp.]